MRAPLRVAAVTSVLAGLFLPARPSAQVPLTSISFVQALDLYERGGSATIAAALVRADPDLVLGDLQKFGRDWARRVAATGARDRRRLVLAAVALEAAQADYNRRSRVSVPLIEWACDVLFDNSTPLPGERPWYLATLALMENSGNAGALATHLMHARKRVADEPRFQLTAAWADEADYEIAPAQVVAPPMAMSFVDPAIEYGRSRVMSPYPATGVRFGQLSSEPSIQYVAPWDWHELPLGWIGGGPAEPRRNLWRSADSRLDSRDVPGSVRRKYERAAADPAVAAEAHLRLGYIGMVTTDLPAATDHLNQVLTIETRHDIRYLAYLFQGWAYERGHDLGRAADAYRQALREAPGSQSAALFLAAALQADGRLDEAEAAITASLARPTSHDDPWRRFGAGDLTAASVYLAQLRQVLQ